MFERLQIYDLNPWDVARYERCYLYQPSHKFGYNSPLNISHPQKNREHAVLYRDKIYYFRQQGGYDEKELFKIEPDILIKTPSVPLDVTINPKIFIIGTESSGKTTIAADLAQTLDLVHIRMDEAEVVDHFVKMDSALGDEI